MELKIIRKKNYTGKIRIKEHNETIEYYTKKQMKTIYPNKNYMDVGEIGNESGISVGEVESLSGQVLPIYKEKAHSGFTEKVVGYIAVDEHNYLAVVKNVLMKRILILVLVLVLIGGATTTVLSFNN